MIVLSKTIELTRQSVRTIDQIFSYMIDSVHVLEGRLSAARANVIPMKIQLDTAWS